MKVKIYGTSVELGSAAAEYCASILNQAIAEKGAARLVLSTGASQLDTLKSFITKDLDWTKIEMFHLDEYIDLPDTHPASFRKYLKDKFVNLVPLKQAHFVNPDDDIQKNIADLTKEIRQSPIDLALIGIGENAHIAFNDPPADFETKDAYIVVDLDEKCKKQQVGEGWFRSLDEVPKQAISMSVYQILQSEVIVSCVPYGVKANAVRLTLEQDVTNQIPATILKRHPNVTLFLDKDSSSSVKPEVLKHFQ